jgi:hypothetical protein
MSASTANQYVICISPATLLTLQVPFFFKHAIDALSIDATGAATANYLGVLQLTPVALMLGYGIARAGAAFCGEMRNVVFAKVSQSVIRGMAKQVRSCSRAFSSVSIPGPTCDLCNVVWWRCTA